MDRAIKFTVVTAALLTGCSSGPMTEIVFSDHFDNTMLSDVWDDTNCPQSLVSRSAQDSPGVVFLTAPCLLISKDPAPANITVRARLIVSRNGSAGVVVRFQNPETYAESHADAGRGEFRVDRITSSTKHGQGHFPAPPPAGWFNLTVETGPERWNTFNDTSLIIASDPFYSSAGAVGIIVMSGTATIDDFVVEKGNTAHIDQHIPTNLQGS